MCIGRSARPSALLRFNSHVRHQPPRPGALCRCAEAPSSPPHSRRLTAAARGTSIFLVWRLAVRDEAGRQWARSRGGWRDLAGSGSGGRGRLEANPSERRGGPVPAATGGPPPAVNRWVARACSSPGDAAMKGLGPSTTRGSAAGEERRARSFRGSPFDLIYARPGRDA
jgi:hypothetical protein